MKLLYGANSKLMGIHHSKVVCIRDCRCSTLWIGSANFTRASEHNHEVMLKLTEHHELGKPKCEALLQYCEHFDELFGRATPAKECWGGGPSSSSNARSSEPPNPPPAPPPAAPPSSEADRNRSQVAWGERTEPPVAKAAPPIPKQWPRNRPLRRRLPLCRRGTRTRDDLE